MVNTDSLYVFRNDERRQVSLSILVEALLAVFLVVFVVAEEANEEEWLLPMLMEEDCLDTLRRDVDDSFLIKFFFLTTSDGDHRDSAFILSSLLPPSSSC